RLVPDRATYYPSHIHYEGVTRKVMTASASFTFARDDVENPLSEPFEPRKRWTCWSSGRRTDWFTIDFGTPRTLTGFDVYFFDDPPTGECRPPASFEVQRIEGTVLGPGGRAEPAFGPVNPTKVFPERPRAGENRIRFQPETGSRFRVVFRH